MTGAAPFEPNRCERRCRALAEKLPSLSNYLCACPIGPHAASSLARLGPSRSDPRPLCRLRIPSPPTLQPPSAAPPPSPSPSGFLPGCLPSVLSGVLRAATSKGPRCRGAPSGATLVRPATGKNPSRPKDKHVVLMSPGSPQTEHLQAKHYRFCCTSLDLTFTHGSGPWAQASGMSATYCVLSQLQDDS